MADIIDIPKIPGTYHGNKVRHRDRYKFIVRAKVHFLVSLLVACVALPLTASVLAQSSMSSMTAEPSEGAMMSMPMRADGHVPLGVTGGDLMTKGKWMISYRYMRMEMDNNLIGTDSVSPEQIVSTVSNRFFGLTGQPSTLRVVPTKMTTNMHMFGLMYAPTQSLTVVGMIPYLDRSMKHVTFEGPSGTARLGTFTTTSSGIGDVKLMSLYRAWGAGGHRIHLNAGLSLPTGSIDEEDAVLTPGGGRPTLRLPYPMQLGSGTFDLMPGVTYKGQSDRIGWGAQYLATIRLGDNDEGYTLGDVHRITGWGSYSWNPTVSLSLRASWRTMGKINGIDPQIVAPVQTADPDLQGGDRVDVGLGLNVLGQTGSWRGLRSAIELSLPVHQDLNGPQMKADWTLAAGVKYMF